MHHIGVVQSLLKPVMQHALDMLKDTYNSHYVRSSRGHGGRPNQLWHQYPHPGGNPTLPQGYDAVAEYESANPGKTVTRRPAWVAERDPISNDQAKRLTRHQAILNIWGPDATRVWPDKPTSSTTAGAPCVYSGLSRVPSPHVRSTDQVHSEDISRCVLHPLPHTPVSGACLSHAGVVRRLIVNTVKGGGGWGVVHR